MVPPGPGVSLPHLGVPALIPPSPAALSPPTPPAHRFLPPIAPGPFPLQGAVGPAQPPQHTHPRVPGRDKDPGHPPTMTGQGETLLGGREQMSPGVTLTNSLIAMRSRGLQQPPHPENRSMEPASPPTIRLDRENICAIGRLQSLREIHSLYLQQNQIEKIENLGCFPNLRFLSLAGNRIRRVENLQPLRHLRILDLSHNQIQTLDPDELPRTLRLLDLTGNECTHQHGYRELVLGALPHLLQLDAQLVHGGLGEEEEEGGSSSSEDEDDELLSEPSGPFTAGKGAQTEAGHVARVGVKQAGPSIPRSDRSGRELRWPCQVSCNSPPSPSLRPADFFADLHRELAGHSRRRQRQTLEEHRTRLEELEELRERRDLLLPPAPLSPGRQGAACIAAPGPRRSQPRPQAKPGTQLPPLPGPGRQHACPQPRRAPGRSQPRSKALEEETHAKGARNRQLPQIPRTSTAPRSWD
ncbi:LOW QUALITY PROTEIN: leucine-rich repeat-containing protein 46 [Pelecanus crispus]|uniref:LOW QUALITY PROTEIN: leucine-rich repeat-containing protein 46 n=1 Tax=Pelecanus crispus TaxID=36300 RepID=UPI003F5D4636